MTETRRGLRGSAGEGRTSADLDERAAPRISRPKDKTPPRTSFKARLKGEKLPREVNVPLLRGDHESGGAGEGAGTAAPVPSGTIKAAEMRRDEGERNTKTVGGSAANREQQSSSHSSGGHDAAVAAVGAAAAAALGRLTNTIPTAGQHVAGSGGRAGGAAGDRTSGMSAQTGGDPARRGRTQARKQRSFLHGKHQQRVGTVISRLGPSAGQATLMDKKRKLYSNTSQQPLWSLRKITINPIDKDDLRRFPSNAVHNHRYTVFSFIFKNLWEQFHRVINWWFLLVAVIQSIPQLHYNPGHVWSTALPLSCVLVFGMVKALVTDYCRRCRDSLLNGRVCYIVDGHQPQLRVLQWKSVRVGNILRLRDGEEVPADIVVLATSNADGVAYAETAKLDGETSLKFKQGVKETRGESSPLSIASIRGRVVCEKPSVVMNAFTGSLKLDAHPRAAPLDIVNLIQRGSHIRNTEWLYGVVIYTGNDTRIQKNAAAPAFKRSHIEGDVNGYLIMSFSVLFLAVLISVMSKWSVQTSVRVEKALEVLTISTEQNSDSSVYMSLQERDSGDSHGSSATSSSDSYSSSVEFMLGSKDALQNPWMSMLRFLSVYAPVLPLSLPLVLDSIYVLQSLLIQGDELMRGHGFSDVRTGRSTHSLSTMAVPEEGGVGGGENMNTGGGLLYDSADEEQRQGIPGMGERSGEERKLRSEKARPGATGDDDYRGGEEEHGLKISRRAPGAEKVSEGYGQQDFHRGRHGSRWKSRSWTLRKSHTTSTWRPSQAGSRHSFPLGRTVSSLARRLLSRGDPNAVSSSGHESRKESYSFKVLPQGAAVENNGEQTDAPATPREIAVGDAPVSFIHAATPAAAALDVSVDASRDSLHPRDAASASAIIERHGEVYPQARITRAAGDNTCVGEAKGEGKLFPSCRDGVLAETSEEVASGLSNAAVLPTVPGSTRAGTKEKLFSDSSSRERLLSLDEKAYFRLRKEVENVAELSESQAATGGDFTEGTEHAACSRALRRDEHMSVSVPFSPRGAVSASDTQRKSQYKSHRHRGVLYRIATFHAAAQADGPADDSEKKDVEPATVDQARLLRARRTSGSSNPASAYESAMVGGVGGFSGAAVDSNGTAVMSGAVPVMTLLEGRYSGNVRCMEDSGDEEIWPEVHNPALTPNLGQIDFVFADKTGTITQNDMTFSMCSVAGKIYGFNPTENGRKGTADEREPGSHSEKKKAAAPGRVHGEARTASFDDKSTSPVGEGMRRRRRTNEGEVDDPRGQRRSGMNERERMPSKRFMRFLTAEEQDADLDWYLSRRSFDYQDAQEGAVAGRHTVAAVPTRNTELSAATAPRSALNAAGVVAERPDTSAGFSADRQELVAGREIVDAPLHGAPSVFGITKKSERGNSSPPSDRGPGAQHAQEESATDVPCGGKGRRGDGGNATRISGGVSSTQAEAAGLAVAASEEHSSSPVARQGSDGDAAATGDGVRSAFARHAARPDPGSPLGPSAGASSRQHSGTLAARSHWYSSSRVSPTQRRRHGSQSPGKQESPETSGFHARDSAAPHSPRRRGDAAGERGQAVPSKSNNKRGKKEEVFCLLSHLQAEMWKTTGTTATLATQDAAGSGDAVGSSLEA